MLVLSRKVDQHTQLTIPPSDKPTVIDIVPVQFQGDKVPATYAPGVEISNIKRERDVLQRAVSQVFEFFDEHRISPR